MIDDNHLNYFMEASEEFREAAAKEMARESAAKLAAIGPGIFPAGRGEVITPMSEADAIEAAKTELRKVAMQLHAEARAVLQNVFLCPADVVEAVTHIYTAQHATTEILTSKSVLNALNLPNK